MKNRSQTVMVGMLMLATPLISWTQVQSDNPPAIAATNDRATYATQTPDAASEAKDRQLSVVCSGDQLTISASNSPLSAILAEIGKCSGAKIDSPESVTQTRFFETIGPGPIQDVLSYLLNATGLNYVIQTSDSNPRKVEAVFLMARVERGETSDDPSVSSGRRAFLRQVHQDVKDDQESTTSQDAPVSETPSSASPAPTPSATAAPAVTTEPAHPTDSAPMPPPSNLQDRIADMQRLFEQRRQMVQEQSSHQQ